MTPIAKILSGLAVLIIIILGILLFTQNNDVVMPPNGNDEPANQTQEIMAQLPQQITVDERNVTFDRGTIPQEEREEYTQMPVPLPMNTGEDPIHYLERYLGNILTAQHIREEPEFFDYGVSFYQINENNLAAFMRVENIPDDSIGASEQRFDFSFNGNNWSITWYGERNFCRRPDAEFWLPADQLCP